MDVSVQTGNELIQREFFASFAADARPVLLLDFDGTLAGFRVDRFQARPWAGVSALLNAIQREGRTRMAVITGRPAGEILPMLRLDAPIEVWGLHGAERIHADGRRELEAIPTETARALEALKAKLRADSFGGLLEEKANGVVMHWRGLSRTKAVGVERRTLELFRPVASMEGMHLLEFEAGVELRCGRDKGGAVRTILSESAITSPAVYLGDDWTDESAFKVLEGRGLSVLVKRELRPTAAQVWLRPPEGVRQFLRLWMKALES